MGFFSKFSSNGHQVNGEYLGLQATVKSTKAVKTATKSGKTMPTVTPKTKWYEARNN